MIDIAKLDKFHRRLEDRCPLNGRSDRKNGSIGEACAFANLAEELGLSTEERTHYMLTEGMMTPEEAQQSAARYLPSTVH